MHSAVVANAYTVALQTDNKIRMQSCCVILDSLVIQHMRLQAARIAAAYEADKAAALKAEERIPEMRRPCC